MNFFLQEHSALYAAFDVYPSKKGASTHIHYFANALYDFAGDLALVTLADTHLPTYEAPTNKQGIEVLRFKFLFNNYLERATHFSEWLSLVLHSLPNLQIAHFRDIWSGTAILNFKGSQTRTLFEVNALPSLELPMIYANIHPQTLQKIKSLENDCLLHADHIVTVSNHLKQYLVKHYQVPDPKITVIQNGYDADLVDCIKQPKDIDKPYLLYFGAMQPWQGVDILIRAMQYLPEELHLVVLASQYKKNVKFYQKLAQKLGIEQRVQWYYEQEQNEVFAWIQGAQAVVAPLTDCLRNSIQGCCPLKIIEALGNGAVVISSKLPAVEEIVQNNETGILCRPNRPIELARAIEKALVSPDLKQNALQFAQQNLTWKKQCQKLKDCYQKWLAP